MEPDFSSDCRQLLEQGILQRSQNFELDPFMRRACKDDVKRTCGPRRQSPAYPPDCHLRRLLHAPSVLRAAANEIAGHLPSGDVCTADI